MHIHTYVRKKRFVLYPIKQRHQRADKRSVEHHFCEATFVQNRKKTSSPEEQSNNHPGRATTPTEIEDVDPTNKQR